ncbi:hypothetical protein RRG08_008742 [Elysia crispata]|uniref:Uncharacterized protein n=1 Tax=Elysia crispata TaxID=231223 RepID=A0AAE0YUM1_9GAST|nr:hypothetical protein RRG08_008742 [Elysia crispata]
MIKTETLIEVAIPPATDRPAAAPCVQRSVHDGLVVTRTEQETGPSKRQHWSSCGFNQLVVQSREDFYTSSPVLGIQKLFEFALLI